MINYASDYLKSKNHKVETIKRAKLIFNNPTYKIEYSEVQVENKNKTLLIEGDFLTDKKLINWLYRQDKFDAIICWFIGVHGVMVANETHRNQYDYLQHNPTIYRMNLHRELFIKSSKLLKADGIVSIIDRTQFFKNDLEKSSALEYVKSYYQLENYGFEVVYMDQKEIDNPAKIKGVPVKKINNIHVVNVEPEDRFALTSIICMKK